MTALAWLIPCALLLGLLGLAAFLWSLNSGQFEDLEGASWRVLRDDEPGREDVHEPRTHSTGSSMDQRSWRNHLSAHPSPFEGAGRQTKSGTRTNSR